MIILDTHIWLWWFSENSKLTNVQIDKIITSEQVGVSAISLFEVSWLSNRKRIELPCPTKEWFEKALTESNIDLVPITPEIANLAAELPEHHSDPQDRLIIATAVVHDAFLLSADGKFKLYSELDGKLI